MNINELRAEVKRRQQAANRKANRLRAKGIDIGGTSYDPRRDTNKIGRYNRTQLANYLNQLNNFTSRTNQFVGLSGGQYVSASEWRKYRAAERKYNSIVNREYSKVADLPLPSGSMTISERDATSRPVNAKNRRASGGSARMYEPINIKPENVASAEALRKLTAQRMRQTSKEYKPEKIKFQRSQMNEMLKNIGATDMIEKAKDLTDDQFNVLWNYSPFPEDLSRGYERVQMLATGGASAQHDRVMEDARADINDAFEWVKNTPVNKPATRRKKK